MCDWKGEAIEGGFGASLLEPAGVLVSECDDDQFIRREGPKRILDRLHRVGITNPRLNVVARCRFRKLVRHDRERLNGETIPAAGKPLTIDCGDRRIVFRRVSVDPHALLLNEQPPPVDQRALLTPREQEVLTLVEEGRSNAEIAAALWIAPATARTHLEHIYSKLGVQNRTAAVRAYRNNTSN